MSSVQKNSLLEDVSTLEEMSGWIIDHNLRTQYGQV